MSLALLRDTSRGLYAVGGSWVVGKDMRYIAIVTNISGAREPMLQESWYTEFPDFQDRKMQRSFAKPSLKHGV